MPKGVDPSSVAMRNQMDPPADVLVALKAGKQQGQITTSQLRERGLDGRMLMDCLPEEERVPHLTVVGTKARSVEGIHVHRAR